MSRTEVLKMLKTYKKNNAKKYGILTLGLFGSTAQNKTNEYSDIDIVVKLEKQDLFNIIGIKQDLEDTLHTQVDIISYRERMNAFLKQRIDKEAVYV